MSAPAIAGLVADRIRQAGDTHFGAGVAVEVREVSKFYPQRRWFGLRKQIGEGARPALRDVSLTIREGEMVGLLGPNGAGKTTLLKSIATLLQVSSGQIQVFGRDVEADPIRARRAIGLVTCDERSFYWRLSGRQNLRFFGALQGMTSARANERIEVLLDALGLTDAADLPYRGYSTGMRQKLSIARGLLTDPGLVIYDEPTRSLDPLSAQNIRRWIMANRSGSRPTTHLIATNQLQEAEQLCDRVVILNRGSIIAEGPISQIRERFRGEKVTHRVTYTGCSINGEICASPEIGLFDVASETDQSGSSSLRLMTDEDGRALTMVLDRIIGRGGVILRCETVQAPLDEVFCSLLFAHQAVQQGES